MNQIFCKKNSVEKIPFMCARRHIDDAKELGKYFPKEVKEVDVNNSE